MGFSRGIGVKEKWQVKSMYQLKILNKVTKK
jgi:hypothetical protein